MSLFIGGTNDGVRMDVPDLPIVRLVRRNSQEMRIRTEDYRMEKIQTANSVFTFYVANDLPLEAGLSQLFSGYNRDVSIDWRGVNA